jgi:opacity protein-like surface antigen
MRPGRGSALVLAQLLAGFALAPPAAAADDSQLWTTASVTVKLSARWRISEEATARFSDARDGLYEIEANTLLGYRVGDGVTLWAGYTHNPTYSSGHFAAMEHRAREQVTIDNLATLAGGRLAGRLRLEQRWREGLDGTGWRVRPFVRYALPLRKGGRTSVVLSTEPFFNLNTTTFQRTRGLDRVRTFVGISTPLARNVSLDAGYLNQHSFLHNAPDVDDHIGSLTLNLAL